MPIKVHFSGIGGVAMCGAARLAVELGYEVHGSDNPLYPPASEMVASLNIPVATQYHEDNLNWNPDLVVIGNALTRGNPEVEAVLERRLVYVSMPEWIKQHVLQVRRPIVICGTHGKTTTTALLTFLLHSAGLSPGFLVGGQPLDFPYTATCGKKGSFFVIEGDEYDSAFFDKRAKFFHYLPEIAVVTSLEFDHADIYPNIEVIEQTFRLMLRQIPRTGKLVLCANDPRVLNLSKHAFSKVITYGINTPADYVGSYQVSHSDMPCLTVHKQGSFFANFEISLWGEHNAKNTLAAIAVADTLSVPLDIIRDAVRTFRGVKRRMEVFLEHNGVTFVDDFAHHPAAIFETICAARQRWQNARVRVLCEPRSNTMVTNIFQRELVDAFSEADEVWFGPIHRAEKIPPERILNRQLLCRELNQKGVEANWIDDPKELARKIWDSALPNDLVLIFSNGSFGGIYETFQKFASHSG